MRREATSLGWSGKKSRKVWTRPGKNAAEISRLGKDLYKRLADLSTHWVKLGKNLDRAVEAYNSATGSLESRVLVTARKFIELETSAFGVEIEAAEPVDTRARALQTPEMSAGLENGETAPYS